MYNKIPIKEHFETGVICVKLLSELITVKKITSYTVLQVESREGSESVKCICHTCMNKLNSLGVLEAII